MFCSRAASEFDHDAGRRIHLMTAQPFDPEDGTAVLITTQGGGFI